MSALELLVAGVSRGMRDERRRKQAELPRNIIVTHEPGGDHHSARPDALAIRQPQAKTLGSEFDLRDRAVVEIRRHLPLKPFTVADKGIDRDRLAPGQPLRRGE